MLSHFSVKNYKCLADVSLPLTPIHVLIGQNDTGKTSLLKAIESACRVARLGTTEGTDVTELYPGEWSGRELVWQGAKFSTVQYTLHFDERTRFRVVNEQANIGIQFKPVRTSTDESFVREAIVYHLQLDDGRVPHQENAADRQGVLQRTIGIRRLGSVFPYRLRPNHMSQPSVLRPSTEYTLDEDGFGLPTLLDELKDYDVERFLAVQSEFAKHFPQFLRIRLENAIGWERTVVNGYTQLVRGQSIGKQVWLRTKDGEIRLQQASDGAVLLLGFLALIHSPDPPKLLLLEEVENGIHPKRLIEVAKLLRQFVKRDINSPQIIMTTHSPYLLSEFQPEEVTLMRRQPDGSAKAFPLRDAPHIRERMGDGFYLGELWYNLNEEDLLK